MITEAMGRYYTPVGPKQAPTVQAWSPGFIKRRGDQLRPRIVVVWEEDDDVDEKLNWWERVYRYNRTELALRPGDSCEKELGRVTPTAGVQDAVGFGRQWEIASAQRWRQRARPQARRR